MKSLKKIFIIILTLILILSFSNVNQAESITLEQICSTFNNSSIVKQYADSGSVCTASSSGNNLTIAVATPTVTTDIVYTLNGSILSATLSGETMFTGLFISSYLADAVGQLHGHPEGAVASALNLDQAQNYTLENEGFQAKMIDGTTYEVAMDINKKFPLEDVTNVYLEVADLENMSTFISGDGSAQKSKGNVILHKSGYGNEAIVFIGEKNGLTENTYKSILSVLHVMFGSDQAPSYFQTNYSSLSEGNKDFNGFKVEVNPTKSDMENAVLGSDNTYQFVRLTIDKNAVSSAINGTNNGNESNGSDDNSDGDTDPEPPIINNNNNNNNNSSSSNNNDLPYTGINDFIFPVAIVSILTLIILLGLNINKYKDVK